ncbi:MAG: RNA methyltransferase [Candidatus Marinimicrobia bacterium]|nr:RNA methyltransferase [Candidatus Neomarinimicrobiota bacterium]MBL7023018.1 RNA methyltransferase [Candidatus Neomarinimicrobiota bacterium]MBL7109658.1 RNA methyltransferase [Candidatus Neomarinimicrobiota bacterium]
MKTIKRTNDELKAARPTLGELKFIPRVPVSILVENVRSVHNVGSIFRSADGFGAEMVYLSGYTAYPPRDDLHKVALGSEESVPWEHYENPIEIAQKLKNNGVQLVALEQTSKSNSIYETKWDFPICFIVGNEVTGVSDELIKLSDFSVEIPMHGVKQSLNVSVATGVVGYEISRAYNNVKDVSKLK